jgi:hypothetical protein
MLCTEQEKIKTVTRMFSFETAWLKHEEFLPKMKEIWEKPVHAKNAADRWYIKVNRIKKFLKGWGNNLKGQTRRYKMVLKNELDELEKIEEDASLPVHLLERKTFIQTELMRLLEEEEMYWHKRSNETWLLQGDSNTGYFHKKANGKKRKNIIFNLEKDGENIDNDEDMVKHATEYYKELFGPSDSPIFTLSPDCWTHDEKITEEENSALIREFSEEEIKKVVKNMKRNTAPGPDHIPIEFYQTCWEIIKEEVMDLVNEFWVHELDIDRLNYGVITLIPKTKEAVKIQQYRPICLLNVSYKIITKALMLRFEGCMS